MRAGDGKLHPLGNIGRVIPDTLQILGNHQDIQHALAVSRILRNLCNQILLALGKQVVNHIVVLNDTPRECQVPAHKGVQTVGDHLDGRLRHLLDMRVMAARAGQIRDDLRDVARLIADALDIRNHLENGRDQTQVACHRLLLQQEL